MPPVHRIQIGDSSIEYTVRRSKRRKKTVEISIVEGSVVLASPMRTPNAELRAIVEKRSGWILARLEALTGEPQPLRFVSGEKVPYMGGQLDLLVEPAATRRPSVQLAGRQLVIRVPRNLAEDKRRESTYRALASWYKEQAAEYLADSVSRWLPAMGREVAPTVLVRGQRARWGSCSSDGTLRFTWRLAMVEPDLIDSVVVHELAHLDVMDHSPAFWDVVLRVMPDARERRKRLNEAGRSLRL